MEKSITIFIFVLFSLIINIKLSHGQLRYLGLETELNDPFIVTNLNPKSKIIDDYMYVPTKNGIYRKNLNETENTNWDIYAFDGVPIKDFVINGNQILAITTKTQDSLLVLSNDNGLSYINYTSNHFFEYGDKNFLYRISQNPQNVNSIIVFHAFYGVSKSTDFGKTWNSLSTVLGGGQSRFIDFHPTDTLSMYYTGETLFLASFIFASFDGGATWANTDNINTGDNCTHFLAFHPTNPNIIFSAGEGRITKSVNKGLSWELLPFGQETGLYIPKIIFDKSNPEVLYMTGYSRAPWWSVDIYKSIDGGNNWSLAFQEDLSDNYGVLDFFQYKDKLILVTMNRGVYQLDLASLSDIRLPDVSSLSVYPNPVSSFLFFSSDEPVKSIEIVDMSGKTVKKFASLNGNKIDLSNLATGVYFSVFHSQKNTTVRKIIKQSNEKTN